MLKKLKQKFGAPKVDKSIVWKEANQELVDLIRGGKADEALEAGQKLVDFVDRKFSKDAPEKATTYNNVGMALMMHGDFPLAEECFREALAMRIRLFGEEHREVAVVYMNMSQLYKVRAQQILALFHEKT
ncbi:MAG: tetratricopeptide repeat protein [Desulfatibacillum sp.]|nr:tetratricopeptide repeat protein [Desulfatibacillum sp.]